PAGRRARLRDAGRNLRYAARRVRLLYGNRAGVTMPVPIRVLVAKPGLDGHDRGAKVIARALRDAGMEVIYTGLRQTPEMIVNSALQEDVHVIGLSILSGAHNAIVPRVMDLLKQKKMDDVLVVVGGIIPDQDVEKLKQAGVAAIFQPGTPMDEIVSFIRENVKPRGVPAGEREWSGYAASPGLRPFTLTTFLPGL